MKTQIPLTSAPGRVLQSVAISDDENQIALIFTDDTFAFLTVSYSYETLTIEPGTPGTFNVNGFSDYRLIEHGLMTAEEVHEMRDAHRRRQDHYQECQERATYERLRAKYGDTPTP